MTAETLSIAQAQRAWWVAQDFAPSAERAPDEVLAARTWARALGGADPYFALFARGVPVDFGAVEEALRSGAIRISPAVRGCMYLVPKAHADACLAVAQQLTAKRNARDLDKAGGTAKQLTKTTKAVLAALEQDGPATTAELRKHAKVAKAITSFGAKGKKVGLSSSLPPALRTLEFEGAIERRPVGARLDTESFEWSVRRRGLEPGRDDLHELLQWLAQLFFGWYGPASLEHFVTWSGATKTAAREAIAALEDTLVEVEVEVVGRDEPVAMLASPASLELAHSRTKAKGEALVGLQDPFLVVRGGPACVCPPAQLDLEIPRWGRSGGGPIRSTQYPHLRSVLVDGQLAGFWEVDAAMEAQHLTWLTRPSKAAARRVDKQLRAVRGFMAESLGHAKIYAIDSAKKIDARFELVRDLKV